MDFRDQLNAIIGDDTPFSAAGLTFLSDIPSDDRATLALMWPGVSTARRRKIAATLVQMAEDNIDYDFSSALGVLLGDPDAAVRRIAVEGLAEDESLPILRRMIEIMDSDADPEVRAAAANILGPAALRAETGKLKGEWPARLQTALLRAVRDPSGDEELRRRALESVSYFSGSADVETEIRRAYTAGGLLPASAVHAMGRTMNTIWSPVLLKELQSKNPVMRYEAAQAVGELGERALVPALLPLLDDDDLEVQLATIWSLGQLGGRVALQALEMLRKDADLEPATREAVDEALTEIRYADDPLGP
jgi:HEAT repeat protein